LQFGFPTPDVFAYLDVFSSGLFGGTVNYEATHQDLLTDPNINKRFKVFWSGMGTEDFLFDTGLETRALFEKYTIDFQYYENGDGHDWFAWREFLIEFAPLLFRAD
jgi:enterochelin esterase-like enzyme